MRAPATNLLSLIERSASDDGRRLLSAVQGIAGERALPAYLVGGGVRDALLGHPSPDLDITVEADAIAVAGEVAQRLGAAQLVTHEAFRTATVTLGRAYVDLITARREEYVQPGALPRVIPSDILDDLARRDFTVNAIALGIAGPRAGELIDPFGGVGDLDVGVIRVLHDQSFQDDATRLLRAARYAARFRFELEPLTRRLATRHRGFLSTISPARVRNEFVRCFTEARPADALAQVARLDLPGALVDGLRYTRAVIAGWNRLQRAEWDEGVVPWLLPVLRWDQAALEAYIGRFSLTAAEARVVRALPAARSALTGLARRQPRPSEIVARLEGLPPAALLAWVRVSPASRRGAIAARYLEELRSVRPRLTSEALKSMGVPEGPLFGAVVRVLRAARLDEPGLTLDDERRLVQHMLEHQTGA
jgi:tRNA nucleotidyltransferase (CCA-adding enzyme)